MANYVAVVHVAISLVIVVGLILGLKLEPIVALILGAAYLGFATGQGADTAATIAIGFGDLLGEIGLLITFGVLIGSLLHAIGAAQSLAGALVRTFGAKRLPYAYGVVLCGLFPSVYSDVLVVITAPLTKLASVRMGRGGHGILSASAITGMVLGVVFVVPGAAALALSGAAGVSVAQMILFGVPIGLATVVITIWVFNRLVRMGLWAEEKDQEWIAEQAREVAVATPAAADPQPSTPPMNRPPEPAEEFRPVPLVWALVPLLLTVVLIVLNVLTEASGSTSAVLGFLGDAHVALFIGLLSAYLIAQLRLPAATVSAAVGSGLRQSGSILVLTGVSGGLAAVVEKTGIAEVLSSLFHSGSLSPILLAWLVAAVLHAAVGSVSVAAITAISILTPTLPSLGSSAIFVVLGAGAGALFLGMVNANAFWLFKSVLGLTTRGTFKAYTLSLSIASVVSLGLVLGVSVFV